jgi:hypothetical protein
MRKRMIVTVAVAGACMASVLTTSASSVSAAPERPLPALLARLPERLRSYGLSPTQVRELSGKVGVEPEARDYDVGRYLVDRGVNPVRGIHLQLGSGKPDPAAAIRLGQRLTPTDLLVTSTEIEQQVAAGVPRHHAPTRARLQRAATLARPYLARSVPGFTGLWIEDSPEPRLVAGSADGAAGSERTLGGRSFAGLPIELRTSRVSREGLGREVADVQAKLRAELPEARVLVSADPSRSQVRLKPTDDAVAVALRADPGISAAVASGQVTVDAVKPAATAASAAAAAPLIKIRGGSATSAGNCTWGFTGVVWPAPRPEPDYQLVTSAHFCHAASGIWGVGTQLAEEVWGGAIDAGRHPVPAMLAGFVDNAVERSGLAPLDITSTTGWWAQEFGDVVCRQGRATGHACGCIYGLFTKPTWVPGGDFFLYAESPTLNDHLYDKGGPWFYGNSAFGIHSGGCECQATSETWGWGVYGAIDFAEEAIHFKVLTV